MKACALKPEQRIDSARALCEAVGALPRWRSRCAASPQVADEHATRAVQHMELALVAAEARSARPCDARSEPCARAQPRESHGRDGACAAHAHPARGASRRSRAETRASRGERTTLRHAHRALDVRGARGVSTVALVDGRARSTHRRDPASAALVVGVLRRNSRVEGGGERAAVRGAPV